ncbi:MAG: YicC family protein [Deltaproteobacteria bacterium]|nr:YicC family protein [Deltaproteobacteria bacterium]
MIRSMTGYGRAQGELEGRTLIVEVKSVNHRYKDINVRLPRRYNPLEHRIRELLGEKLDRGRLDLSLNSREGELAPAVPEINVPLVDRYHEMIVQLRERYGLQEQMTAFQLLSLPDVIVYQEKELNPAEEWPVLERLIHCAMEELDDMRLKEGGSLLADIESRLREMKARLKEIEARSPLVVTQCHDRLSERLAEMTKGIEIDPIRLAQELAFFADRCDISEEIVRLRSHMDQFAQVLNQESPLGRKLDFILQEMHREINTIGSKASDSEIALRVVEFKTDLERLREQVQNIE